MSVRCATADFIRAPRDQSHRNINCRVEHDMKNIASMMIVAAAILAPLGLLAADKDPVYIVADKIRGTSAIAIQRRSAGGRHVVCGGHAGPGSKDDGRSQDGARAGGSCGSKPGW